MDDGRHALYAHEVAASEGKRIGTVTAVSGTHLTCRLADCRPGAALEPPVGAMVKIPTAGSIAFGFVGSESLADRAGEPGAVNAATAEIDLLGEIIEERGATRFMRGISRYPALGAPIYLAGSDDLRAIYQRPDSFHLAIGTLYQDASLPAYLVSQEFLVKHSAILGTTGSGKSCAVTLILRRLLTAHPNGHVVLLDPHNEYGPAFRGLAEEITTRTLQLPYWLLSYEEIVEVLCSRDPTSRTREATILKEALLAARRDFAGKGEDDSGITVDMPIPYRLQTLVQRISDAMGKLDRPDNTLPYLRLLTTIENLRKDRRYAFMFASVTVRDCMKDVLSRILRIPVKGRPITIIDLSGVPSEIVNVVVSLLCRLIFDFALWSLREEQIPILLVCEEAHRYIPRDEDAGFQPTRRAIARIAKEGRKYGVSLCLVTQRPSEISESILSQCSTVFALRMNNEKDQNFVRRTLPEDAAGLLRVLPSLRQQEAVVVGEGVTHPMRLRFADLPPEARPSGDSTNFPVAWQEDVASDAFLASVIDRWRRQAG